MTSFVLRLITCCVAFCLPVQGFAIAMERVSRAGHFHVQASADHGHDRSDNHDDDGDDDHDHAPQAPGGHHGHHHQHSSIEHHTHETVDAGVVYVADDLSLTGAGKAGLPKRVCLDQETVVARLVASSAVTTVPARCDGAACAFQSHIAEPLERPPRRAPD